jgi:hypothetical protein
MSKGRRMPAINFTAADVEALRHERPEYDDFSRALRAAAENRGDVALKLATLFLAMFLCPDGGTTFTLDLASQQVGMARDDALALMTEITTEASAVAFHGGSCQITSSEG